MFQTTFEASDVSVSVSACLSSFNFTSPLHGKVAGCHRMNSFDSQLHFVHELKVKHKTVKQYRMSQLQR